MKQRHGSCRCGRVTFSVDGEPTRVGLCHCANCHQESGSAFTFYGVWPRAQFRSSGLTREHRGQQFCPECGCHLFSTDEQEAEIKLGALPEPPTGLTPTYELWVKRREAWLPPIEGAEQHQEDRVR